MQNKLTGFIVLSLVLGSPLITSCSRDADLEQDDLVGDLPLAEIIHRIAPPSDQSGPSNTSQSSDTSVVRGRRIRHDEHLIDLGLASRPGFDERFCSELRKEIEKRVAVEGSGSGVSACNFHVARGERYAWVTVSRLASKEGRYQALVVVDEW